MTVGRDPSTEANRKTVRDAFEGYDSISFNELWTRVQPAG